MGRKWTDEQKKAFAADMKRRREAKLRETELDQDAAERRDTLEVEEHEANQVEESKNTPKADPEPVTTNASEQSMTTILKQALEAIATLATITGQSGNTAGISRAGKLTGTVEKYALDPSRYPSPIERLADEPRLQRFGFKENYELRYEVSSSEYTTIDNIRMREPKFVLDLVKVVYDEETGEKTNGRYVMYRVVLHEDPDSALTVARQNNVNVDDYEERAFLNEMRYLQMRDWLLECFYKPSSTAVTNKRDMVLDGKLVEYFEVNSESSAKIPFSQLETKL